MDFITDPVRCTCNESAYEHITRDVTRAITVTSLLEVWGVARERGDRDGDDLVLNRCTLDALDDICGTPGLGEAMEYVEWAIQEEATDSKGRAIFIVRFPKFFKEKDSPDDRYKKQHSEAQARYRNKKKVTNSDITNDITSDALSDITMTHREEKRREDIKTMSGKPDALEVLTYLNQRAKRDYRAVDSNLRLIAARLGEGAVVAECKAVIDVKVKEWADDPKWSKYLRPETLFNATKFASYVGEAGATKQDGKDWE